MPITFTSTRAGTSADYMRYVYGGLSGIVKTDRYLDSTLLDFALAPVDAAFVRLDRGAYIKIASTTYPFFFTGYITNEPAPSYLGKNKTTHEADFGYKYQATADEYILSMKPIGVVAPFLNVPMGTVLKTLVEKILPGVFDLTNIQDGPIIAQYVVTPDKVFKDVFHDLCAQASYIFYGQDHKLYFAPQDDVSLGTIALDGHNKHFTPSRLSIKPSQSPIINDVTVLGQLEPQTYMHEYFVGTGLQSAFPLTAGVFGADNCLLVQDTFQGTVLDSTKWLCYSGGSIVPNTASATFQLFDSYLNVTSSGEGYDTWLQTLSAIPMEGRMRFTHGEWDFLSSNSALLGCVWSVAPNAALTGCLYGLKIAGTTINPIVGGVVDSSQFVSVTSSMRYVIRTVVEFTKHVRVPNRYTYLDATGVLRSVTSDPAPDTAIWQTIISEVDPTNGTLINQFSFKNESTLNGETDVYGIYTPVVVDSTNLTLSNVSISIPVACTLETSTDIGLVNGSFDLWDDETHPSGWINPLNVIQETTWSDVDLAIRMSEAGSSVEQDVSSLLNTGVTYYVQFRTQKHVVGSGSLTVQLYGTGLSPVGATFDLGTDLDIAYKTLNGVLTAPLTDIPFDCKLKITYSGGGGFNPVWIDSLTVYSEFLHQLVGPNELDAMDGLAPVATIVAGNANSQTKSTFSGAPQYNPGQDQLVFFKNSVTLTASTPPENQIIRLSYRAAGSAVGRVLDAASIATEEDLYDDDGVRSTVRTDLQPRPRTSLECELAAKAIVAENSFQHYEGTYTQFSTYFTQTPRAGMPIIFTNLPNIPYIQAEEISQVKTTILCDHTSTGELFNHELTFGKPDHIRRLLNRMQTPIDAYQQNPASAYADPAYVDVTQVALNYIEDVTKPFLVNWDEKYIYADIGQDLSEDATQFEVRYTDEGWGKGPGKNLVLTTTLRPIAIPRNPRGRVVFIRQINSTTGLTSRYASCLHVAFPTVNSNAYIRDWTCTTLDLANPLVVGTDLSNNRFKLSLANGEQVYLAAWHLTLKTPPASGVVTADILVSTDKGLTWESIFPTLGPSPNVIGGQNTKTGTQFSTRFLDPNDMLRYDLLQTDGTAAGLSLELVGRVYQNGAAPIGAYGTGTGSTGAPTGSGSSPGTTTGGIAAQYLFTEGGGTVVQDTSGLHRDGSFGTNAPSFDAAPEILHFTNTNQYITLPDATLSIDSTTLRDFSIETWVKPIAATFPAVISFGNAFGAHLTLDADQKWHFFGGSEQFTIIDPTPAVLDEWQQVVVTRIGSTVKMFVNAVEVASITANTAPLALGTGPKYLGEDPALTTSNVGPTFDLGVTRFYTNGLSPTAITGNFNGTSGAYSLPAIGGGTGGGGGGGSTGGFTGSAPAQAAAAGYNTLNFGDDFTTFDTTTWFPGIWYEPAYGTGQGYAASGSALDLSITPARWNSGGNYADTSVLTTSRDFATVKAWKYGYFEARMKWDVTAGAWPAFWMNGDYGAGSAPWMELDIFEGQGNDSGAYFGTLHTWPTHTQTSPNRFPVGVDYSQWHTYGALWTPGNVKFYLDDVLLASVNTPAVADSGPNLYIILSMQMGNNWNEGNTSGVSATSMHNYVDWVKVWK